MENTGRRRRSRRGRRRGVHGQRDTKSTAAGGRRADERVGARGVGEPSPKRRTKALERGTQVPAAEKPGRYKGVVRENGLQSPIGLEEQ